MFAVIVLKHRATRADARIVKCQRLVVEMGEDIFSLDLHPRLTVLAGLGPVERATLAAELVGALTGERSGVHVELRDSAERRLAILRPRGGRHRVIDVDREFDVTHEFTGAGGDVDLLARAGFTGPDAVARLHVTGLPRSESQPAEPRELELALVDQRMLWGAAENVRRTARALGAMAGSANAVMSEQRLVDEVETAHRRHENAQIREDSASARGYRVALGGAALSVPLAAVFPLATLPLLAAASLSMGWVHSTRQTAQQTSEVEADALRLAGAQSYLGFHLQRVNGMLSSAETRRRLGAAADLHRKALATWAGIAGQVSVDWAFEHQSAIVTTALVELAMVSQPQMLAPSDRPQADTLARMLTDSPAGYDEEVLPLILDEPFTDLDTPSTRRLLGQLSRWSGLRQVIVFTGDQVVRDWAAAEAELGKVHLVDAGTSDMGTSTIDLSVAV
jgi:hypothetical protein